MRNIVIIGGGLAGLITSIQLIRAGISCTVIEKKSYPFHRVCGEYVSNEVLPFLKRSGLYPEHLKLPQVKFFEFSSVQGRIARLSLDLGGFGISRYSFDHFLYDIARREGVSFQLNNEVTGVRHQDAAFLIDTTKGPQFADVVVGAFGKRSKLDVQQNRSFTRKRSPWVGVKYHVRTEHADELVALHNFRGGYCGVCNVENGLTNLCYLTHRDNIRIYRDIREMEKHVLFSNPVLRDVFRNASFVTDTPEVINEVSFATKNPVENHILMAGDSAGMIAPVCGNGMAIAIHGAKILSEQLVLYDRGKINRDALEKSYSRRWRDHFARRLWVGRNVQRLFGDAYFSGLAVSLARLGGPLSRLVVSATHGKPF